MFREFVFLTYSVEIEYSLHAHALFFFAHLYLTQGVDVNMAPFFLGHLVPGC